MSPRHHAVRVRSDTRIRSSSGKPGFAEHPETSLRRSSRNRTPRRRTSVNSMRATSGLAGSAGRESNSQRRQVSRQPRRPNRWGECDRAGEQEFTLVTPPLSASSLEYKRSHADNESPTLPEEASKGCLEVLSLPTLAITRAGEAPCAFRRRWSCTGSFEFRADGRMSYRIVRREFDQRDWRQKILDALQSPGRR